MGSVAVISLDNMSRTWNNMGVWEHSRLISLFVQFFILIAIKSLTFVHIIFDYASFIIKNNNNNNPHTLSAQLRAIKSFLYIITSIIPLRKTWSILNVCLFSFDFIFLNIFNRICNYGLGSLVTIPKETKIKKQILHKTHFIISCSHQLRKQFNLDTNTKQKSFKYDEFCPRQVEYLCICANDDQQIQHDDEDKLLLYIHGGGYSLGGPSHIGYVSRLAASTNLRILFVHYSKPPIADIPFQVDQILTLYFYLLLHHQMSHEKIIILGDSAGGGLITLFLQKLSLLNLSRIHPCGVILFSPWIDLCNDADSWIECQCHDLIVDKTYVSRSGLIAARNDVNNLRSPFFSAIYAKYYDFDCNVMIFVSKHECLFDDSERLVEKLKECETCKELIYHSVANMIHAWPIFYSIFPEANEAMDEVQMNGTQQHNSSSDEDDEKKDTLHSTPTRPFPKSKPRRLPISISTPVLSSLAQPSSKEIKESSKRLNVNLDPDDAIKLYRTVPSYHLLIRDIIKADIPIIQKRKFLLCPHKNHCIQNAFMKGLWRTFAAAFIFKSSLSFFQNLFSGKLINFKNGNISWNRLRKIFLSQDSLLFANIFALMSFTYKVILCTLRRYRLRDPVWHKTVAGFLCAFWIFLDDKDRRNTIALYCFVRAMSDFLRLCVTKNKIPKIKHFDVATFTASQAIIMFGAIKDPKGLDAKYYKWILNISNLNETAIQNVLRSPSGGMYRLSHEPFTECCPSWHAQPSCLKFCISDWFISFWRAIKMYMPVHMLPTLLLSPKSILLSPFAFIQQKTKNIVISAMFLATYIFNMRYTICFVRNIIRDDPAWLCCFGGIMAGLSLFIETPRRRPELMLYCVPRAMEWIINRVKKDKLPRLYAMLRTRIMPTLVFQIAVALWCTIMNISKGIKTSNSINMTVLKIVLGSKH